MKHLTFNFYGMKVEIGSASDELLARVGRDFSYFAESDSDRAPAKWPVRERLTIEASQEMPQICLVPPLEAIQHSQNSITYEIDGVRYNDYHGEALSIFDYKQSFGRVSCGDLDRLHELTFLLTLSRVEKALDLRGLHKIHAFGVTYRGTHLIGQMPSKGGKTTTLMNLLRDPEVQLLSDDTPLVTRTGKVLPFPIRIGIDQLPADFPVQSECVYGMKRKQYGYKTLLDVQGLSNEISEGGGDSIHLFFGVRSTRPETQILACSKFRMLGPVFASMVVGLGLPMVIEYFLETGIADFFRKSKIVLSRSLAMTGLILRARTYKVVLGKDPQKSSHILKRFLFESSSAKKLGLLHPGGFGFSLRDDDAGSDGRPASSGVGAPAVTHPTDCRLLKQ
jgi:hypothetical protein